MEGRLSLDFLDQRRRMSVLMSRRHFSPDPLDWRCEEPAQTGNETHLTYVRRWEEGKRKEIIASSDQGGTLQICKCGRIIERWRDKED